MRKKGSELQETPIPVGRAVQALLLVAILTAPAAALARPRAQQAEAPQADAENSTRQETRSLPDLLSDNLDRVAASDVQILAVVNKEPGLLLELKRVLAQDAAMAGQVLEESELVDSAIAERLRTELRARVLATRLLQRYGFLLPRVNPNANLGPEQKFALQERAQSGPLPEVAESQRVLPAAKPRGTPFERTNQVPLNDQIYTDGMGSLPERRIEPAGDSNRPETVLAASRSGGSSLLSGREKLTGTTTEDLFKGAIAPGGDLQPMSSLEELSKTGRPAAAGSSSGRAASPVISIAPEPVRIVHRPNPYAEVPSLYDLYIQAAASNRPAERFGLDVFRRGEANPDYLPMDLPVGPNYVVGPGDGLSIDLWGGVSQRFFRTVDRQGRVTLPEAGPVLVSGKTLGEVQQDIQRVLRTQFRDISADVSLQRLRTVRVYVVGDVAAPGAYDISSLSTPLNALFAAGGVTPQGSLRRLQHYRGKQLVEEVDAYDLLLHGIRGDLERLENGDSLLVPPLGPVVKADGMVRRPAIYELRNEKTLEEALDLSGGILPAAALRRIEVQRLVAHEKRTMLSLEIGETSDAEAIREKLRSFTVQDGDEIHIFPIAPYNTAAVYLEGHVLRPGRYSYKPGMKFSDLVASYNDLLPEPSRRYAEIIRLHAPDYHPEVESFDLAAALENPAAGPKLEPLDTVRIFGRYDFEPEPEILVGGEVRAPGRYRTSGQQHLRDAIYQAGGVTPESWLDSAQLFRSHPDGTTRVFSVNLRAALEGDPLNNLLIQPRDRILVHRQPERVDPPSVYVRGDVARPGRYPLAANMRVADLVRSAGGVLRSANPEGGDLTHYAASGNAPGGAVPSGHQAVNLAAALEGNAEQDLPLHDGDVLTVPQLAGWTDMGAAVTLRGEVRRPGTYGVRPGERLSSLLQRAGGLLPTAYPRAAVFERIEVHELQQKSREELIRRIEQESTVVKTSINATGTEEAALQQAAILQRERALDALRRAPVTGRLVIHLRPDRKSFERSPDDIELRAGDSLMIPKQPGAVVVVGQVYNANALTYTPGRHAGWYLSRAGGPTQLANRGGIFIVRADGSVTSGQQGGLWSGGVLSSQIGPGDMIVVPEKAVLGGNTWKNIVAIAQIAQAGALAAAVAIP